MSDLPYKIGPGADLWGADLWGADLRGADLRDADLRSANLRDAELRGTNLQGTQLSPFLVCPEVGAFIAWKKVRGGTILRLKVPKTAWRCGALTSRKCRASHVKVVEAIGTDKTEFQGLHNSTIYRVGETTYADYLDIDPRVECTNGIHFFITQQEAEEWT